MNLKKYTPFIIPTISLLLVLFLAFRWYNLRTQRDNDLKFDMVEIENLTPEETEIVISDPETTTVRLEPEEEELALGQIKYHVVDDRVLFSVSAELPLDESAVYQVWLSSPDTDAYQKAFELTFSKAGYTGSASVSTENLPLEIIVSREVDATDDEMEQRLLQGIIESIEPEEETEESAME